MISILSTNGKKGYNLYEYICDFTTDIANLPIDCSTGSTAFVIETSEVYMINSKKKWVKI